MQALYYTFENSFRAARICIKSQNALLKPEPQSLRQLPRSVLPHPPRSPTRPLTTFLKPFTGNDSHYHHAPQDSLHEYLAHRIGPAQATIMNHAFKSQISDSEVTGMLEELKEADKHSASRKVNVWVNITLGVVVVAFYSVMTWDLVKGVGEQWRREKREA